MATASAALGHAHIVVVDGRRLEEGVLSSGEGLG